MLVNGRRFVPQIIGSNDRGVAGDVASCEPTLLQNGDVGHTMILCQVIGGSKSMAAATHDYPIVCFLRLRRFPEPRRLLRESSGPPSSNRAGGQCIVCICHDLNRVICGSYCGSNPTVAG